MKRRTYAALASALVLSAEAYAVGPPPDSMNWPGPVPGAYCPETRFALPALGHIADDGQIVIMNATARSVPYRFELVGSATAGHRATGQVEAHSVLAIAAREVATAEGEEFGAVLHVDAGHGVSVAVMLRGRGGIDHLPALCEQ